MELTEAWQLVKDQVGSDIRITSAWKNSNGDWLIEYAPINNNRVTVQQDGKVIL